MDMKRSTMIMANNAIHPDDRPRYIEFMDSTTVADRLARSPGFIEEAFRFKTEDGNFRWGTVTILMLPGSTGEVL